MNKAISDVPFRLLYKSLNEPTAFCKNTGHGASGRKKICATTKNWPIGKIEYVATVDLINSYNIDRINILLLHLALYKIVSLNISEIAIWLNSSHVAKYQPYSQTIAM